MTTAGSARAWSSCSPTTYPRWAGARWAARRTLTWAASTSAPTTTTPGTSVSASRSSHCTAALVSRKIPIREQLSHEFSSLTSTQLWACQGKMLVDTLLMVISANTPSPAWPPPTRTLPRLNNLSPDSALWFQLETVRPVSWLIARFYNYFGNDSILSKYLLIRLPSFKSYHCTYTRQDGLSGSDLHGGSPSVPPAAISEVTLFSRIGS